MTHFGAHFSLVVPFGTLLCTIWYFSAPKPMPTDPSDSPDATPTQAEQRRPADTSAFQWQASSRRSGRHIFRSVLDLSPRQYALAVSAGVPATVVELICEATGLPQARLASMLGIPRQTLLRQLAVPGGADLGHGEGDAVADLCRFVALAQLGAGQGRQALLAVGKRLGDWLKSRHDGLEGDAPETVLSCGVGRAQAFLLLKADIAHRRFR